MPRRAAKKDLTHDDIADGLRNLGWSVLDLHQAGQGVPDLAIGKPGFACLVECKSPGGKLTPDQIRVKNNWSGPYIVADSLESCLTQLAQLMVRL